jgi:nucleotidyltransferase/DNA polymerase involved in DNA repair
MRHGILLSKIDPTTDKKTKVISSSSQFERDLRNTRSLQEICWFINSQLAMTFSRKCKKDNKDTRSGRMNQKKRHSDIYKMLGY